VKRVSLQQVLDRMAAERAELVPVNAAAMRRVAAASLPRQHAVIHNAQDSKEGQAVADDLALTTTTAMDGRNGCGVYGNG
jgi:hypothetical protein